MLLPAPAEGHREPNTSQGKDFKPASEQTSSLCVRVKFLCVPSVKAHSGCWAVRADLGSGLCLGQFGPVESIIPLHWCRCVSLEHCQLTGPHEPTLLTRAAGCRGLQCPAPLDPCQRSCGWLPGIKERAPRCIAQDGMGWAPAPAAELKLAVLPAPL